MNIHRLTSTTLISNSFIGVHVTTQQYLWIILCWWICTFRQARLNNRGIFIFLSIFFPCFSLVVTVVWVSDKNLQCGSSSGGVLMSVSIFCRIVGKQSLCFEGGCFLVSYACLCAPITFTLFFTPKQTKETTWTFCFFTQSGLCCGMYRIQGKTVQHWLNCGHLPTFQKCSGLFAACQQSVVCQLFFLYFQEWMLWTPGRFGWEQELGSQNTLFCHGTNCWDILSYVWAEFYIPFVASSAEFRSSVYFDKKVARYKRATYLNVMSSLFPRPLSVQVARLKAEHPCELVCVPSLLSWQTPAPFFVSVFSSKHWCVVCSVCWLTSLARPSPWAMITCSTFVLHWGWVASKWNTLTSSHHLN